MAFDFVEYYDLDGNAYRRGVDSTSRARGSGDIRLLWCGRGSYSSAVFTWDRVNGQE